MSQNDIYYDEEHGVYVDPEDGTVYNTDGERIGVADFEDDFDDTDADDVALFEAAHRAASDDAREELARINSRIEQLAARDVYEAGRADVQAEAQELLNAEAAQADAYEDAMRTLATKLGRPVSNSEASRIAERLPQEYDQQDILSAAAQEAVTSFTERGARGREARTSYFNDRLSEIENASSDEEHDSGGMGGLFDRLEQSWAAGRES